MDVTEILVAWGSGSRSPVRVRSQTKQGGKNVNLTHIRIRMVRLGVELNVLLQYIPQYPASHTRILIPYFPLYLIYLRIDTVLWQKERESCGWCKWWRSMLTIGSCCVCIQSVLAKTASPKCLSLATAVTRLLPPTFLWTELLYDWREYRNVAGGELEDFEGNLEAGNTGQHTKCIRNQNSRFLFNSTCWNQIWP